MTYKHQNTQSIPRLSNIETDEFVSEYYLKNSLVIVEDFAKRWLAIERWGASYLSRYLHNADVVCSKFSSNKHPDFGNIRDNRYIPEPTQIKVSPPSLAHTLAELVTYAASKVDDNPDALENVMEAASVLQGLTLGLEFTTIDDFYFRSKNSN